MCCALIQHWVSLIIGLDFHWNVGLECGVDIIDQTAIKCLLQDTTEARRTYSLSCLLRPRF